MQKLKKALKSVFSKAQKPSKPAKTTSMAAKKAPVVKKKSAPAKKSAAPVKKAAKTAAPVKKAAAPMKKADAKKAAPKTAAPAKKAAAPAKPAPKAAAPKAAAPAKKAAPAPAPAKKAAEKPSAPAKAPESKPEKKVEAKAVEPKSEPKAEKAKKAPKEEIAVNTQAEEAEVILTDAEGRRYCRVKDCDQASTVDGYCRYHYLLFWKNIQNRKKILAEGKLERYIEELTARYPDKFLELLRKDLKSEKDFMAAIQELEIDESAVDGEFEDEAQNYLDEVRGMSSESGGGSERDEEF